MKTQEIIDLSQQCRQEREALMDELTSELLVFFNESIDQYEVDNDILKRTLKSRTGISEESENLSNH